MNTQAPVLPAILAESSQLVAPAMEAALDRLSPEIRRVVDYHMGWRDAAGQPVRRPGSKGIRPGLAVLSAMAGGGEAQMALPGALAVEFLNNWAFLIDDVMDGDRYRRQRETAWVVFGSGQAICTGTALLVLAQQLLVESDSQHRADAVNLVLSTAERMLAGQTLDMTFESRLDIAVAESMTMTESKTASLMHCATSIGAVLAGAAPQVASSLAEFGQCLGIAFQARDDMLGVWGTPDQTGGRPPGFDVRARKGTLPIVVALNAGEAASDELRDLMSEPDMTDAQVQRCAHLIDVAGGRDWTAELARSMVTRAVDAIDGIDATVRGHLREIAMLGMPDDVAGS